MEIISILNEVESSNNKYHSIIIYTLFISIHPKGPKVMKNNLVQTRFLKNF